MTSASSLRANTKIVAWNTFQQFNEDSSHLFTMFISYVDKLS